MELDKFAHVLYFQNDSRAHTHSDVLHFRLWILFSLARFLNINNNDETADQYKAPTK